MRWTHALIPTLREDPQDAEIASHRLLLRAGYIRKLTGGIYTFLPLGLRTLRKIEGVIREEMDRAGAMEILMPALQPRELWAKGPRFEAASRVMFAAHPLNAQRRATGDLLLGPTHEEVVTQLVAYEISSYRQLPKTLYQIQTKFRDELRPRFGLMRAKEFIMKDAYSFDVDDVSAERTYRAMYEVYIRIFDRCGLKYRIVEADTGVMGGSFSHEFSVPCSVGESEIAYTDNGAYAAAIEKARSRALPRVSRGNSATVLEEFPTPGITTIDELAQHHGVSASDQIKTLVYLCDSELVLFLLRGDHSLNEAKVTALGFQEFRPATDSEILQSLGALPGSLGAVNLSEAKGISRICLDEALREQKGMVTGANRDGFHLRGVDVERDIVQAHYQRVQWADLRVVLVGEADRVHGKPLRIERAIEVGHVFKLGTKYSEAFQAHYLDSHGKAHPCVMGCYGIGVTRTLQAIVEQSHDGDGIVWPLAVAPYTVVVQILDLGNVSVCQAAEQLYKQLLGTGVDVLLDDRDERPGVKFKDADLLGLPFQVRFGKKFAESGKVEVKVRSTKATEEMLPEHVEGKVRALVG